MPSRHRSLYQLALIIYFLITYKDSNIEAASLEHADFDSMKEALAAADKFISVQRETIYGIPDRHPDIIIGSALLDQFWYCKHKGIGM